MAVDHESEARRRNKEEGNPSVKCNVVYKSDKNLNIYLRPNEAIRLARNLLKKALVLVETGWNDGAVQVWSVGPNQDTLSCGLDKQVANPRRNSKKKKS